MRYGVVILPEQRWPDARAVWRRAEALGFDHAWTYDHVAWGPLHDEPWFGAVPTLAAAATVTEQMRLGTLVASPNFRHPVPFARDLIGLDDVSGGRFVLGIGAGGAGWDATILGQQPWSPAERADRFAEFVDLMDRLLRDPSEPTTFHGDHYAADGVVLQPGCVQQPRVPFAVAGIGPRSLRLAARFGQAWVTVGDRTLGDVLDAAASAEIVRTQINRLEEASAAADRDLRTEPIDRIVLTGLRFASGLGSPEQFRDAAGRYEEAGVTDLCVHWPRPSEPFATDPAVFERIFGG